MRPASSAGCRYGVSVLGLPDRPDRPPHRRLRAGAGVAEPVAARRVRGHPERRARPGVGARRRSRAPGRLRGPAGAAEGAAGAAAGLAGHPRRTGLRLTVAGADPLAVRLLLSAAPRRGRRHRRRRLPEPGRAHADAARREGARRPVDRTGELRHGAHAGVRVRAARRRVRHPRLPRGAHARGRRLGRPRRSRRARPTPSASSSRTSRAREAMGEAARALAIERYAWPAIAERLEAVYASVTGHPLEEARAA